MNVTSALPPRCHFDRSVVEKSPDSVGQAPMRWEISRLRVSMIYKYFIPISTRSPARDDMLAGSSQPWEKETMTPFSPPAPLSFRPERSKAEWSGVEWRNLRPQRHQCLLSHCHFDRNGAKRSGVEWSGEISCPHGTSASPSHCHFDRNGAKRSEVEKSPVPTAPVPPLPLSFRPERSKAEWSGVEKSPAPMVPVPPPPTVISTETEQSGVKWRNLPPQWYQCLPLPLSFRPKRSKAEWSGEISRPHAAAPLR